VVLLGPGIIQEIGDDAVQPLGFPGHDVEQAAVLLIHLRYTGEHADRAGNGSQRIPDFMGDGSRQPPHGRQAVLHAHFTLQPADLGEIVENINTSRSPRSGTLKAATRTRRVLRNFVGASKRISP